MTSSGRQRRSTESDSSAAGAQPGGRAVRRPLFLLLVILVLGLLGVALLLVVSGRGPTGEVLSGEARYSPPRFVGSDACSGCHRTQSDLWRNSQHKQAMDHATDKTVLGDFDDARFEYAGVQSRFFRRDGKFLVETDGPDGKLATFEVKYTFGVDPLQQYLIEFPDGRLQALSIAWDVRPKDKGGQRWFHLYPNEKIRHDDVLHWTKLNQNWNYMCAQCHSTGLRKNYDAKRDRFATSWAEISVGCEACHGEGSQHIGWAQRQQSWWPFGKVGDPSRGLLVQFDERAKVGWEPDPATGAPKRSVQPATLRKEVETCGLCHARRVQISEEWVPGRSLSNTHIVTPIARTLFQADGQMLDEVYNYNSFKQSKMHAAGVTCSDCHDPHSGKLKFAGDNVCLQCHPSDRFAAASHHRHETAQPPVQCVSCHMPTRTYMVVDPRHDHGFRIPRPDLSVQSGATNACNDCHADKTPEWAALAIKRWYGPERKGLQTYAAAFSAAWNEKPDAGRLLQAIASDSGAPGIARASALTALAAFVSPANLDVARKALSDADPMVRIGALDMLEAVPVARLWPIVSPLLTDPVRAVRVRATSLLASMPAVQMPAADRPRFERAAAEFIEVQQLNADRPESRATLGSFFARRGMMTQAEAEYTAALRISAQFAPAAINLADLYRQLGRDGDGEIALQSALRASPRDAGLHHALGLALVRSRQTNAAIDELRQAADIEPGRARYAYVYAVALHSAGRSAEALSILKRNVADHPQDRDSTMMLIGLLRDAGDLDEALVYAEALAATAPPNADVERLIQDLRRRRAR
jgi:predicted CXXCH cytochrome family protein